MKDLHCDGGPIPESLEYSEATAGTNSSDILHAGHDETSDPSPGSIEEFIRDSFSTKLEDPRTGRKIR
jgi:hypothetical protein